MRKTAVLLLLVLSLAAVPASAGLITTIIIGPSNASCGANQSTCFGNTFTLKVYDTGTVNNYTATLQVDTSTNNNAGIGIAAVEFGFGSLVTGGSLTSFDGAPLPNGWSSGLLGNLGAGGCANSGSKNLCTGDTAWLAETNAASAVVPLALLTSDHEWDFSFTTSGALVPGGPFHIGALFGKNDPSHCRPNDTNCPVTYSFKQTGITSADGPAVPEPASLALFGSGLAGLLPFLRRLKR